MRRFHLSAEANLAGAKPAEAIPAEVPLAEVPLVEEEKVEKLAVMHALEKSHLPSPR